MDQSIHVRINPSALWRMLLSDPNDRAALVLQRHIGLYSRRTNVAIGRQVVAAFLSATPQLHIKSAVPSRFFRFLVRCALRSAQEAGIFFAARHGDWTQPRSATRNLYARWSVAV